MRAKDTSLITFSFTNCTDIISQVKYGERFFNIPFVICAYQQHPTVFFGKLTQ